MFACPETCLLPCVCDSWLLAPRPACSRAYAHAGATLKRRGSKQVSGQANMRARGGIAGQRRIALVCLAAAVCMPSAVELPHRAEAHNFIVLAGHPALSVVRGGGEYWEGGGQSKCGGGRGEGHRGRASSRGRGTGADIVSFFTGVGKARGPRGASVSGDEGLQEFAGGQSNARGEGSREVLSMHASPRKRGWEGAEEDSREWESGAERAPLLGAGKQGRQSPGSWDPSLDPLGGPGPRPGRARPVPRSAVAPALSTPNYRHPPRDIAYSDRDTRSDLDSKGASTSGDAQSLSQQRLADDGRGRGRGAMGGRAGSVPEGGGEGGETSWQAPTRAPLHFPNR
jgi:hypothetical protein